MLPRVEILTTEQNQYIFSEFFGILVIWKIIAADETNRTQSGKWSATILCRAKIFQTVKFCEYNNPAHVPRLNVRGLWWLMFNFWGLHSHFQSVEKMHKNIDIHSSDNYFPLKISLIALCASLVVIQSKFLLFDKFLRLTR